MANRAVLGKRIQPTTVSDSNGTSTQAKKVIYSYASSGGVNFITQAFVELIDNPGGFSGDITITMPDGSTYVEDDYLQVISGSTNAFNPGGGSTQVNAPFVRLDDYGETAYASTPLSVGGPEGRGAFISGLDTSSGSGTSSSPYAKANILGASTNGVLENTTFDSGAHIGGGLQVYKVYQDDLEITTSTSQGIKYIDIAHNWGDVTGAGTDDRPAYAVRWTPSSAITSGVATIAYPPWDQERYQETGFSNPTEVYRYYYFKPILSASTKNTLRLQARSWEISIGGSNYQQVPSGTGAPDSHFYFGLVIFYEKNFKNGESL